MFGNITSLTGGTRQSARAHTCIKKKTCTTTIIISCAGTDRKMHVLIQMAKMVANWCVRVWVCVLERNIDVNYVFKYAYWPERLKMRTA